MLVWNKAWNFYMVNFDFNLVSEETQVMLQKYSKN